MSSLPAGGIAASASSSPAKQLSRFALAVLLGATAAVCVLLLDFAGLHGATVPLSLGAAALGAYLGGAGPGVLAGATALIGAEMLLPPHVEPGTVAPALRAALIIAACITLSVLCARLRRARDRAENAARVLESRNRELETLSAELERSNQQLQDQAAELEAQAAELQEQRLQLETANGELSRAHALFESLLDASPDIIAVKDVDGRYLVANRATAEVVGRPAAEIVGRADADLYPAPVAAALLDADRAVIQTGLVRTLEELVPSAREGGQTRAFFSVKAPLRDADGKIVGLVVTARDETERRAAEAALAATHGALRTAAQQLATAHAELAEREAVLSAFTDHAPVLMGLTELLSGQGPGGTDDVLHVSDNPASARFFGLEPGATAGRRATELGAPAEVIALWSRHYRDAERLDAPVDFEYEFDAPGGARWLSVKIAPAGRGTAGSRFAYVAQDVTEHRRAATALAESERLLRTVTGNATLALFITGERQQCVYMNPAAERLTGFSLEEIRGRVLHEVVHHTRPDGSPYALAECPIDGAFRRNDRAQGAEVFVHKDGSFYPVAYTVSPIRHDETGRPIGTIIEVRDTREEIAVAAELKEAAARLAESQIRLRRALEHSPIIVFEQDRDLRYTWIHNPALGFTGADVLGRTDEELLGADDAAALTSIKRHVLETGVSAEDVVRLRTPLGFRSYSLHVEPLHGGDGSIAGVTCVSVDVTEREALLANERRSAATARLLQEVTAELSAAATALAVAQVVATAGVRLLGAIHGTVGLLTQAEEQGVGRGALRIIATAELPETVARRYDRVSLDQPLPYAEAARTGHAVLIGSIELLEARYGEEVASLARSMGIEAVAALPLIIHQAAPPEDESEGGSDTRLLGSLVFDFAEPRTFDEGDVAALTALAQQCAQALDRARLYEAEQAARAEAEQQRNAADGANRAKSQFLAKMSHELRTPLNAIQGYVQLLQMEVHGPTTEKQREALARVDAAQRHLLGLINDVLNISKLESGRLEYDIRPVPLTGIMEAVAPLIEPQLEARGLVFELAVPASDLMVWADQEKLIQVLLNLLSNAIKFTPEGGRVRLEAVTRTGASEVVFVRVADTGFGIPREKQESVFEPFVQVRDPQRKVEGTGLGLTISRDLARGMGGDLRLRSEPGQGAAFTVTLRRVGGG